MKKSSKKFLRKCVICNVYKPVSELNRFTKDFETSEILINNDKKIQGRSFYVCRHEECVRKAFEEKNFRKYFRMCFDDGQKEKFLSKVIS